MVARGQSLFLFLRHWFFFFLRLGGLVSLLTTAPKYPGKNNLKVEECVSFKLFGFSTLQEGGLQWHSLKRVGHIYHGERGEK